MKTERLLEYFEKKDKPFILLAGLVLVALIGGLDFLTGNEIAFSVFYVIPITLVTWVTGRRPGVIMSLISALVWLFADLTSGHLYSHPLIPAWNMLIRLTFFIIITLLLSALRKSLKNERAVARIDYLTGALNARSFYKLAQGGIDRLQRYQRPFTLAYLDLDNFKSVNDLSGHAEGDAVLCAVVKSVDRHIRKTDVIARLGGDEFALLFPETSEEPARAAIVKIRADLLDTMKNNKWPITFSIGVLTCRVAPDSADELVKIADELMYKVKHDGKNAVLYGTYEG